MENKEVILIYAGTDFWSRPVYQVSGSEYYVKDINLGMGKNPISDLYWSYPRNNPEGEPDTPFHVKDGVKVIIRKPVEKVPTREDKKFTLACMIRANEYVEGRNSVEWLDLASGIHDIDLTKELLQELKDAPIEIVWTPETGYVRKDKMVRIPNLMDMLVEKEILSRKAADIALSIDGGCPHENIITNDDCKLTAFFKALLLEIGIEAIRFEPEPELFIVQPTDEMKYIEFRERVLTAKENNNE